MWVQSYRSGIIAPSSAYDNAGQDAAFNAAFIARNSKLGTPPGGTKWVATTGSDSNPGTQASPYLTIVKAIQNITAGGTVIVKPGAFAGPANFISANRVTIPAGSAGNWTTIRAEVPLTVEITYDADPGIYGDSPIYVTSDYVQVDGIGVNKTFISVTGDSANDSVNFQLEGSHCRLTRWYSRKESNDKYGGHVWVGSGNNYNVVQYGWFNGDCRYGIQQGSAGADRPSGKNVVSMVVGQLPFGRMLEPTALFNAYGSNNAAYLLSKDFLWANCAGIDSPMIPFGVNDGHHYGVFYHPKSIFNVRHIGCGIVNCGAEYGGFRSDSYGTGTGYTSMVCQDSFVAGLTTSGVDAFTKNGEGTNILTNNTIGGMTGGGLNGGSAWTLTNNLTSGATYPVVRSGANGAEQKYVVGGICREYDESGFDVPDTSLKLWPWPYETQMKAFFARVINKPALSNGIAQSIDSFAGNDAWGKPQTYTRRVFQAFGNQIPSLAPGAGFYP